ncbi:MAG: DUF2461 domain-containing protein [Clostridiales bacterium]|nr:DUF2461 domain-containing protein [Clostridiales bacterium]
MFQGFGDALIPFFLDLRFHNDKSFMDANRDRYYREVRQPFYDFIGAMGPLLQARISEEMEVRPAKCLSRINRDTRFTKDKSPYRDHLWVSFRQQGMANDGTPFYWFEISPEQVTWGVGIWGETREIMDAMRRRMVAHPRDFERILPILQKRGFTLDGEQWKKMPVPPEIPPALTPWYLKKQVYAQRRDAKLSWILSPEIVDRVMADYEALAPLYWIFRGCVEEAMNQMDDRGGKI